MGGGTIDPEIPDDSSTGGSGTVDPELPDHVHDYNYNVVETAPTCTEAGFVTKTCACGDVKTEVGKPATGHSYEEVETKPTCTEAGFVTKTCACGDVKTEAGKPATGHSYKDYVCTVCGSVDPKKPEEKTAKLDIHFLELGNKYTGDCTYIKAGDTDILIDAGSRKDSATTITSYVNQYCTDGKLEYVIATHAHQDHIAGFVGSNNQGVFDVYRVGTLIDFPKTGVSTQIYNNYKTKRSNLIANGTKHYTALEWWKEEKGLTQSIEIADGITMNVLYQKYYETSTSNENNYSVCVMFSQGDNHYLFTGDLEEGGEKSLVQSNNLPKVKLYKAGHHGSKTSSCPELMQVIQPEVVCVCCCAGSPEYNAAPENTFPTQDFINNVAPYTDKIYVTSLTVNYSNNQTTSMNGNIVVSSTGGEVTVNCSNNNTILKETAWFKQNRTWPSV